MTQPQRLAAGRAVAARIAEIGTTVPRVAQKAGVDPSTLRELIKGRRWPNEHTREALSDALGWPDDEIRRIALGRPRVLERFSTLDLLDEIRSRWDRSLDLIAEPVDTFHGNFIPDH